MPQAYEPSYLTYCDLNRQLQDWRARYPHLISLSRAGVSPEGRDILVIILTNEKTGPHDMKPALYVDANQHAGEVTGSAAAMMLTSRLLFEYGEDRAITRILDHHTIYILPRVSPDGAERYLAGPDLLRSAPRPYPLPWHLPGLSPADIDGNGMILSMRVEDPHGDWKQSLADDRLMILRQPGENDEGTTYYRLYTEGYLDGPDEAGAKIPPPVHGLDFNRNYPPTWCPESDQRGAGPFPLSEPETRAVADFVINHPNIALAVSLHTYGGFILRPPCSQPDSSLPRADLDLITALGRSGSRIMGYPLLSISEEFTPDPKQRPRGSFIDFLYLVRGIPCFAPELWSLPLRAGIEGMTPPKVRDLSPLAMEEDGIRILTWVDENLGGEGVYPWAQYDHKDLGRVEIGGFDVKRLVQNPPPSLLADEAGKAAQFLLFMAGVLPRISVQGSLCRVGEGLYRVRVAVDNAGFLPTPSSERARETNTARPIKAAISIPPGARIVAGDHEQDLGHLPGGRTTGNLPFRAGSPGGTRAWASWIISMDAAGPVVVEITSDRAGTVLLSLEEGTGDE